MLRARFDLPRAELPDYYMAFANRVEYEIKLLKRLHSSGNSSISDNIIKFSYVDYGKDDDGTRHYYIITEVMNPLIGSEFIGEGHTTLLDLLQIIARFIQVLKLLQNIGVHIGSFDFDSIYLCTEGEGKPMLKIGSLLYADEDTGDVPALPPVLPNAIHDSVRAGEKQSIWTDLYAIFSVIWSLLSGKHYTDRADLSECPQYVPEEMRSLMEKGLAMDNTLTLKQLHNETYALIKKIKKGEVKNIDVVFAAPKWPKTIEEIDAEDTVRDEKLVAETDIADSSQSEETGELILEESIFVLDETQSKKNETEQTGVGIADDLSKEVLNLEADQKKRTASAKKRRKYIAFGVVVVLLAAALIYGIRSGSFPAWFGFSS